MILYLTFIKSKIVEYDNKLYIGLKRTDYESYSNQNILVNMEKENCFHVRLWPRSIYAIHSLFCYLNLDLLHWRPNFCIYLWYYRVLLFIKKTFVIPMMINTSTLNNFKIIHIQVMCILGRNNWEQKGTLCFVQLLKCKHRRKVQYLVRIGSFVNRHNDTYRVTMNVFVLNSILVIWDC